MSSPRNQTNDEYTDRSRRWSYEDYEANRHSRGVGIFGIAALIVVVLAIIAACVFGIYLLLRDLPDEIELPDFSSSRSEGDIERKQTEPAGDTAPSAEGDTQTESGEPLVIVDRPQDEDDTGELTTVEIVERVRPSVVGASVYTEGDSLTPSGGASGIIMSENGYIITNEHVVADAVGVSVELSNGDSYTARIVGSDEKTDLALLHIDADNLTPAEFGNSDELRVGERVVAIGNPVGSYLAGTTTQGIVSGVNRNVGTGSYKTTLIQTDAAVNPGNSGGALINVYGQVVGINTSKVVSVDYEGIGFAIPINEAKPIIDSLMQYGYVKDRTKIGFSGQEINETTASINSLPTGIYIWSIEEDSSLYTLDVRQGDVLTHIDGERVETFSEIGDILKLHKPGDEIALTIVRPASGTDAEKTFDVTVTLLEDRG